jgi:hypothetical protein
MGHKTEGFDDFFGEEINGEEIQIEKYIYAYGRRVGWWGST